MYIINEFREYGGTNVETLYILSLLSICFGIYVITNRNPIIAIGHLIGLFISISCYLIQIGLVFLGLSYIIIYVGAISMLYVFNVLLINVRNSELQNNTWNSIPLAFLIGIFFSYFSSEKLLLNSNSQILKLVLDTNTKLMYVSSNDWDSNIIDISHISLIGSNLYTNYSTWLILSSLVLLLAMIGSIVITTKDNNSFNVIRKSDSFFQKKGN